MRALQVADVAVRYHGTVHDFLGDVIQLVCGQDGMDFALAFKFIQVEEH